MTVKRLPRSEPQPPGTAEALLRCMLDHTTDGIVAADSQGLIQSFNKTAQSMFGYSEAEVINKPFELLLHEIDLTKAADRFRVIIAVIARTPDVEARHKSGKAFPVSLVFNEIQLEGSQIFIGTLVDQTQTKRKEKELRRSESSPAKSQQVIELQHYQQELESLVEARTKELKESEQRYRSLVDSTPGATFRSLVNEPWTFLFISNNVSDITGYAASDFINNNIIDCHGLIHPDDQDQVTKAVDDGIASMKPWSVEYRLNHRNGSTRWIIETAQALRNENGEVMYLEGLILDNTDRKQTELELGHYREHLEVLVEARTVELEELTQRYRTLSDNSPVGLALCTMDGRFVEVNPSYLDIIGYSEKEARKMTFWDVSTAEYLKLDRAALTLLEETGRFGPIEKEYRKKNGELIPVRISGVVIELDGIKYNWSSVEDISELKRHELQLLNERERAEVANRSKSEFLAMMSHEIRTPMNAVIGMSKLALNTALDRQQRNYIEKSHFAAQNLLVIINDVLDFSKIEAGQLRLESIDFFFEAVLEKLNNLTGLRAQEKGLELIFDIPPKLPSTLIGDPTRLTQILVNLVTNAIKFTPQGEVILKVNILSETENRVCLRFEVRDTGIGIEAKAQESLFSEFTQADDTVTRRFGGTGLGLFICKQLVDLMHGHIAVKSEPELGSVFHFDIELGQIAGKAVLDQVTDEGLEAIRILIVDDNLTARMALNTALSQLGFSTTATSSGGEAIEEAYAAESHQKPYDLVLIDQFMPELDGIETVRKLTEDARFNTPKLVMMVSGDDTSEFHAATSDITLSDPLLKPFTPSRLTNSIRKAFGRKRLSPTASQSLKPDTSPQMNVMLNGRKVLLVEDNLINQELAIEVLSMAGIIVTSAMNGEEAIAIMQDNEFDLVLMDIHMPVMDGVTATQLIRQDDRFAQLPIVALTANALTSDHEKYLAAGMDACLAKPFDFQEIFRTLAKCILTPDTPAEAPATSASIQFITAMDKAGLPVIEGLDTTIGLSICQSNSDLFRRILELFTENVTFTEHFQRALKTDGTISASLLAHALKGTASNIGATSIPQKADKLYELCRNNATTDEIEEQLELLESELAIITTGLIQWLNQSSTQSPEKTDPAASQDSSPEN